MIVYLAFSHILVISGDYFSFGENNLLQLNSSDFLNELFKAIIPRLVENVHFWWIWMISGFAEINFGISEWLDSSTKKCIIKKFKQCLNSLSSISQMARCCFGLDLHESWITENAFWFRDNILTVYFNTIIWAFFFHMYSISTIRIINHLFKT